jgi:hypothetical protein
MEKTNQSSDWEILGSNQLEHSLEDKNMILNLLSKKHVYEIKSVRWEKGPEIDSVTLRMKHLVYFSKECPDWLN